MPDVSEFQLADVLTIVGATAAAGLVTSIVELVKRMLPIIRARGLEETLALILAAVLVVAAVFDSNLTGLGGVLTGVLAWVWIGQGAMAFYDKVVEVKAAVTEPPADT